MPIWESSLRFQDLGQSHMHFWTRQGIPEVCPGHIHTCSCAVGMGSRLGFRCHPRLRRTCSEPWVGPDPGQAALLPETHTFLPPFLRLFAVGWLHSNRLPSKETPLGPTPHTPHPEGPNQEGAGVQRWEGNYRSRHASLSAFPGAGGRRDSKDELVT